jgi:hypothetical protein
MRGAAGVNLELPLMGSLCVPSASRGRGTTPSLPGFVLGGIGGVELFALTFRRDFTIPSSWIAAQDHVRPTPNLADGCAQAPVFS